MWAYLEPSQILHLTRCQMSERKMRDISTEPGCISAGMVARARDLWGVYCRNQLQAHQQRWNSTPESQIFQQKARQLQRSVLFFRNLHTTNIDDASRAYPNFQRRVKAATISRINPRKEQDAFYNSSATARNGHFQTAI